MPKDIIATVLEEDYRIEQVLTAMGGPGFVPPDEVQLQTERNKTSYTLSTASIHYATYQPKIAEDAETLKAHYEANKSAYEIPERLQASLAVFLSANYLNASTEVEESALREHFINNRARFVADYEAANPKPEPAKAEDAEEDFENTLEAATVTFELVKDAVSADAKKQAEDAANEAAQSFAFSLYDQTVERDSSVFNTLLEKNSVSLQPVEPFSLNQSNQRSLPARDAAKAFSLGSNRFYTSVYLSKAAMAALYRRAYRTGNSGV